MALPHRPELLQRYLALDQGGKIQAECEFYITFQYSLV